ncbi:MAG: 8-amino-7-oxononanoate synthase [Marmoricola sp.]|nr:8-amino-7-oxononanoate synthase [Marmoricola sp.]
MSGHSSWLAAEAAAREDAGLTRRLFASDTAGPMLDLAGNDYLGLSRDPRVVAGATKAAEAYGAGAGASRLVTGTLTVHEQLESALARFTGFTSALVLSTGYHANLAVVAALADADTLIVSDAHVHASMIDACRLSRGTVVVTAHNDVTAVERALSSRSQNRAIVLVETIYSVLGDAAPVSELADLCARYDALLVADEAHALGVGGPEGRGLLHEAGVAGSDHVVATLTLSKSLGAQGGAVLGATAVRDHLVNTARPFIYDTGLAPAASGAALAALDVVAEEPRLVTRVRDVARVLAEACGVPVPAGAVLAVAMPGPREAVDAVARAAAQGVRIGCFRPPSTPDGISRLRLTAHAHLTDRELDRAVTVLEGLR